MFVNIQQLLKKTSIRKNGYDYISISKLITNENMGKDNRFQMGELEEMRNQHFIEGVAPLVPNRFKVEANAGSTIPFSSDIFIEALDDQFIDTVPANFTWHPGEATVPIIFSSDLLEMYNVFAPSWDLVQLSPETASSIGINLHCEGKLGQQTFRSSIVGFSDRVNSILVPKTFLDWANKNLEGEDSVKSSRIFIKTRDANDAELLQFLEKKNYRINKEKTMFGRSRQVLQGIISGLGVFGLMVILLALMLFSFYLQLVVARSKDNLQLLLILGYSPSWLSKNLARQFIPVYIFVVLVALALTQFMQWGFHHFIMYDRSELSTPIHWSVVAGGALLVILSVVTNYKMVKRLLFRF